MNREEFQELVDLLSEQSKLIDRMMGKVFYRRDVHGETESPKHLLSELAELKEDLEKPGSRELWKHRKAHVFQKVDLFKMQMDEQKARTKKSTPLTDEERETLLTEDEIADTKEAISLKREISKRAKEIRKKERA